MVTSNQSGVSLKPSEMTHGGGLIDDVDVTIKDCKFVAWDYQGKINAPVLALGVTFTTDDGEDTDQYFSAGDMKDFVPSKDGKQAIPVGQKTALNDGSNFAFFLSSAINAGFPEDQLGTDITVLTNLYCHIKRIPQPKRAGIADTNTSGRDKTIITVEKIHALPWDNKGAKKSAAPKVGGRPAVTAAAAGGKANGAAAAPPDEELAASATGAVVDAVANAGGSLPKAKLSQVLFKELAKDPNRNKIVTLAFKDEFLAQEGQPWAYDGTTISM